ncbi:hypothetical protein PR003_g9597 [Phytophthora rubi]|uniref:Uncharacterized protein n=1 Tax=Phytophthora rubi TaxID=129364 RepID=A0A6A3N2Y2_9STRA|nr:hypothetical protein PR001_g9068 [Phytophthora rubi]KAE9342202.1 hypothetical protein PR003_g9597 [Phytophthora rubi]
MVVDVMTKALGVVKFTQFRTAMKLNYIYACEGHRVVVLFAERIAANCGCRTCYQALVSVIKESVGDRVVYIAGIKW